MARLSTSAIIGIIQNILKDLYENSENKLQKRREDLSRKNREIYFKKYQSYIDKVPKELLQHSNIYQLFVNYNEKNKDTSKQLYEVWEYKVKNTINHKIINPEYYGIYTYCEKNKRSGNVMPELQKEVKDLCEDIIAIRNEKQELETYLITTTNTNKGSKQLRKIWPENLHKYLPPDNMSSSKSSSKKEVITPKFINTRMATNLLEEQ